MIVVPQSWNRLLRHVTWGTLGKYQCCEITAPSSKPGVWLITSTSLSKGLTSFFNSVARVFTGIFPYSYFQYCRYFSLSYNLIDISVPQVRQVLQLKDRDRQILSFSWWVFLAVEEYCVFQTLVSFFRITRLSEAFCGSEVCIYFPAPLLNWSFGWISTLWPNYLPLRIPRRQKQGFLP